MSRTTLAPVWIGELARGYGSPLTVTPGKAFRAELYEDANGRYTVRDRGELVPLHDIEIDSLLRALAELAKVYRDGPR